MRSDLIKFFVVFLTVLLLSGCGDNEKPVSSFNGSELNRIINAYLSGDSSAISFAGLIFNNVDPKLIEVNHLFIDSITIDSETKLYYLILESANPAFNNYLLVDNNMNVLLKDNSLNGHLKTEIKIIDNRIFQIIQETFTSRDTFKIQRTSFYELIKSEANLAFRTITGFNYGKTTISSYITAINKDKIIIEFKSNTPEVSDLDEDEFIYDPITKKYTSENNRLRNFAIEQVSRYKLKNSVREISDKSGYERILKGITDDKITTEFSGNEYSIVLSEDWKEFRNFAITSNINREFRGNKYVNDRLGASISIIKLPSSDSSEIFISENLNYREEYENPIRFGNLKESGRHYIGYYEYTCGENKVLLILETPKYTYEKNSETYHNIIKTFKVRC